MFVLIVIPVVLFGYLCATVWHLRHRDDLIHRRERAFATLRQMIESPTQVDGLTQRTPILSDHVRILSERPAAIPPGRRPPLTRGGHNSRSRQRTTKKKPPNTAIIPTLPSVTCAPDETPHLN
jgi:hypothetical protein